MEHTLEIINNRIGQVTEFIDYTPDPIDEYLVIVNDATDWEEIHNYIINDNEIDGIPNRSIECFNLKEYSLRSALYLMSHEESELLKTHPKIENVVLNPDKYPQPQSSFTNRYKNNISFCKPLITSNKDSNTPTFTNGNRSNWSHIFTTNPTGSEYRGVGIASTSFYDSDIQYSLTGKNIDAVIIDSGIGAVHPEFLLPNGISRVKDVILDGPYKVDPNYFIANGYTYTKIIDGVNCGVGIATAAAQAWWTNSSQRSAAFQSLGTISSIDSRYTVGHANSKTTNANNDQIIEGHGTACASQIGGKTFGLAFESNIWNIRILLGGAGGYTDASTALDICTIFHNAKKISQNGNPDPTIINNSYGYTSTTGNTLSTVYTHGYRGATLTYTGNGSDTTVQANGGACRNTKTFTYNKNGTFISYYSGSGEYTPVSSGSATSSSAENAIAAGCIVVCAAGNQNQKLSDYTDLDYNNWYSTSTNYINRVGGIQKGFSGVDMKGIGSIRVGALDCALNPNNSKQGSSFGVRKACYSNNGPMIDIWAPAEMTMAAGYANYEVWVRQDNSNFYDYFFNGTSSASPNTCSLISLFLETTRKATQSDVRNWLYSSGSLEIDIADPYPDPASTGYWSQSYNSIYDYPSQPGDSYNILGNSSLRGATKRVIFNRFANNTVPSISGIGISGVSFTQS